MTGHKSRNKGAAGEREFLLLCRRELAPLEVPDLVRNLRQYQARNGADIVTELAGYAVEIKRAKQWRNDFWAQAVEQADARGARPALAWRADRNPWQVHVRAADWGCETRSGRIVLLATDWLGWVKDVLLSERV